MKQITTFDNSPFFDDYDINKNFYRVLFRPGYSVQTRELNQLQSILAQQISHISDFAIADKTAVIGGNINFNKNVDYLLLDKRSVLSYPLSAYSNGVRFKTIDGISGKVILAMNDTNTNQVVLYIHYDSAAEGSGRHYPNSGEQITLTFMNEDTESLTITDVTDYKGYSTTVFLNESVYYIKSTFVQVPAQALVLSKYNSVDVENENYIIGVLINEETISPEQEFSLYDNAYGTPNETAPGAYRYKITGALIEKSEVPLDKLENFIEVKRLEKGEIANKPNEESNIIPMLEQMLARRTYDESGDYIVDTFNLDIREHLRDSSNKNGVYYSSEGGDTNKFVAQLDPGVGYIRGYEARIEGVTRLSIDKARDTKKIENNIIQLNYSNYITVIPTSGDIVIGGKLNFYNVSSGVIGSGIIAGVESLLVSGENALKLYLININSTSSFYDIKSVKLDSTVTSHNEFIATFVSHNITNIYSSLIYPLSYGYSKIVTPKNIRVYKTYPINNNTGDTLQISTSATNETLSSAPKDYYVYVKSAGKTSSGAPLSVVNNTNNVTINVSNLLVGHTGTYNVKVIATAFMSTPTIKVKTLKTETEFYNSNTDIIDNRIVLSKSDGFKLVSVKDEYEGELSSKFVFDSGGRDTHYEKASINLLSSQNIKKDTILTVTYQYFEHSISGEFFTANSYNISEIGGYNNIPNYTQKDGSSVFLGSSIDFRRTINSSGSYESLNSNAPAINEYITLDVTYYLPRKDRIMITSGKNIVHVKGEPSFNAVLPEELKDAITLYNLDIFPYTFDINDIKAQKLTHKRYTMKDIGSLEKRIKNVEEVALLNKLERDVAGINFDDRFKSGYVVDNFSTSNTGDLNSEHFGVAYDIVNNEIRPKVTSNFVDLEHTTLTNTVLHKNTGIVTLDYDVEEFISQNLGSTVVNIQPYINHYWGTGVLELSPSADIWKQEFRDTQWIYTGNTTFTDDRIIINNGITSSGSNTPVVTPTPPIRIPAVAYKHTIVTEILTPAPGGPISGEWSARVTYTNSLADTSINAPINISVLYQTQVPSSGRMPKKMGDGFCNTPRINLRHGNSIIITGSYKKTSTLYTEASKLSVFAVGNWGGANGGNLADSVDISA